MFGDGPMRMKWVIILFNIAAVAALILLGHYASTYHQAQTKWAYDAFVSRGLLDDARAQEYARTNNGWHPKHELERIGSPDGFVRDTVVIGVSAILVNTILLALRRAVGRGAEPGGSADRSRQIGLDADPVSARGGSGG
jgi:hypothetical protein